MRSEWNWGWPVNMSVVQVCLVQKASREIIFCGPSVGVQKWYVSRQIYPPLQPHPALNKLGRATDISSCFLGHNLTCLFVSRLTSLTNVAPDPPATRPLTGCAVTNCLNLNRRASRKPEDLACPSFKNDAEDRTRPRRLEALDTI